MLGANPNPSAAALSLHFVSFQVTLRIPVMKRKFDNTPYGVFHVNRTTQERRVFSGRETAMDRGTAESEAQDIRMGRGRGSFTLSPEACAWTVLALPIELSEI
jgi:hypothetical protein